MGDVIVLGGGAARLMCALTAAKRGRHVLVLEKANKIGKKILMSGGGRCNFTNYSIEPETSYPPTRTSANLHSSAIPSGISSSWLSNIASTLRSASTSNCSVKIRLSKFWQCSRANVSRLA